MWLILSDTLTKTILKIKCVRVRCTFAEASMCLSYINAKIYFNHKVEVDSGYSEPGYSELDTFDGVPWSLDITNHLEKFKTVKNTR